MKNHWLDQKNKRVNEEKAKNAKVDELQKTITIMRLAKLRSAVTNKRPTKKPCGCKSMNARFLEEAKNLEAVWKKSGLLEGLKDLPKWNRSGVLLESQRLTNEMPFRMTVKTDKAEHAHSFNTKEEMFSHLDMLCKNNNKVWFFQAKLDKKPQKGYTFIFFHDLGDIVSDFMMHRAKRMTK